MLSVFLLDSNLINLIVVLVSNMARPNFWIIFWFSGEVETSAHFTNYPSNRFNMEKNVILQLFCYNKNCFTMNVISFCQIFSTRKTNEATIQQILLDAQEKCDISCHFVVVNWWSSNFPLHGCTIKSHCKVQKQVHNSPNFTICMWSHLETCTTNVSQIKMKYWTKFKCCLGRFRSKMTSLINNKSFYLNQRC